MKHSALALAVALAAGATFATQAADNFDGFRGKMKAGMYEYKMDMDMGAIPGMPPGMGKQSQTIQHCLTQEDIDKGKVGKQDNNNKCEIKDFKMSGNTASYKMVCTGEAKMNADVKISFRSDNGYVMDSNMSMAHQGQPPMTMKQHMEARYLGACAKK